MSDFLLALDDLVEICSQEALKSLIWPKISSNVFGGPHLSFFDHWTPTTRSNDVFAKSSFFDFDEPIRLLRIHVNAQIGRRLSTLVYMALQSE